MMETASPQVVQRWRINCQSFEQSIPINVSAGRVETRINDTLYSAYISNSGRFRLEVPTELRMSNSLSSGESLTDGRVTLIMSLSCSFKSPTKLPISDYLFKLFYFNFCAALVVVNDVITHGFTKHTGSP